MASEQLQQQLLQPGSILSQLHARAQSVLVSLQQEQQALVQVGLDAQRQQDQLQSKLQAVEQREAAVRSLEAKAIALVDETRQRQAQLDQREAAHAQEAKALAERSAALDAKEQALLALQDHVTGHFRLVLDLNHKLHSRLSTLGTQSTACQVEEAPAAPPALDQQQQVDATVAAVEQQVQAVCQPHVALSSMQAEPLSAANWCWLVQQHKAVQALLPQQNPEASNPAAGLAAAPDDIPAPHLQDEVCLETNDSMRHNAVGSKGQAKGKGGAGKARVAESSKAGAPPSKKQRQKDRGNSSHSKGNKAGDTEAGQGSQAAKPAAEQPFKKKKKKKNKSGKREREEARAVGEGEEQEEAVAPVKKKAKKAQKAQGHTQPEVDQGAPSVDHGSAATPAGAVQPGSGTTPAHAGAALGGSKSKKSQACAAEEQGNKASKQGYASKPKPLQQKPPQKQNQAEEEQQVGVAADDKPPVAAGFGISQQSERQPERKRERRSRWGSVPDTFAAEMQSAEPSMPMAGAAEPDMASLQQGNQIALTRACHSQPCGPGMARGPSSPPASFQAEGHHWSPGPPHAPFHHQPPHHLPHAPPHVDPAHCTPSPHDSPHQPHSYFATAGMPAPAVMDAHGLMARSCSPSLPGPSPRTAQRGAWAFQHALAASHAPWADKSWFSQQQRDASPLQGQSPTSHDAERATSPAHAIAAPAASVPNPPSLYKQYAHPGNGWHKGNHCREDQQQQQQQPPSGWSKERLWDGQPQEPWPGIDTCQELQSRGGSQSNPAAWNQSLPSDPRLQSRRSTSSANEGGTAAQSSGSDAGIEGVPHSKQMVTTGHDEQVQARDMATGSPGQSALTQDLTRHAVHPQPAEQTDSKPAVRRSEVSSKETGAAKRRFLPTTAHAHGNQASKNGLLKAAAQSTSGFASSEKIHGMQTSPTSSSEPPGANAAVDVASTAGYKGSANAGRALVPPSRRNAAAMQARRGGAFEADRRPDVSERESLAQLVAQLREEQQAAASASL